ncbi:C-type lectin 37Da-like [Drosophila innubila]|uniref:C-type lectin 37Da-like n=1 Tax=Drosophila innubila TaxID=198719 RepID=UPI00148C126D|nr:C-type lectin 37Da-like [Drosophila innubila]
MLWHKLIGFAILSLVLTQLELVQSDVPASGCRNNFSLAAGKCLLVTNSYYNWYEADRHCRSLGAGLLSIQNQTQLQQIEQWIAVKAPWVLDFWTSGNSLGQTGAYYWQSTGELARYLPWSPSQPQTKNGDCLVLESNKYSTAGYSDFRLSNKNCTHFGPHICEQQQQKYNTRICLKPGSYENAQVLA